MNSYTNIDEYIANFPVEVKEILEKIRCIAKELAPLGEEAIRYGIPTVRIKGKNRLYYAAFADHISLYPASDEIIKLIPELAKYRTGKGTFQFKLASKIPWELIKRFLHNKLS